MPFLLRKSLLINDFLASLHQSLKTPVTAITEIMIKRTDIVERKKRGSCRVIQILCVTLQFNHEQAVSSA